MTPADEKGAERHSSEDGLTEESLVKDAMAELDAGETHTGSMAKAVAESDGDKNKTQELYLKYRVQSLRDEKNLGESGRSSSDFFDVALKIFLSVCAALIFVVICFIFTFLVLAAIVQIALFLPLGFGENGPVDWVPVVTKLSFVAGILLTVRVSIDEFPEFCNDLRNLKTHLKRVSRW